VAPPPRTLIYLFISLSMPYSYLLSSLTCRGKGLTVRCLFERPVRGEARVWRGPGRGANERSCSVSAAKTCCCFDLLGVQGSPLLKRRDPKWEDKSRPKISFQQFFGYHCVCLFDFVYHQVNNEGVLPRADEWSTWWRSDASYASQLILSLKRRSRSVILFMAAPYFDVLKKIVFCIFFPFSSSRARSN